MNTCLEIFSTNGSKVFEENVKSGETRIDVRNLRQGLYTLKLLDKCSQRIIFN